MVTGLAQAVLLQRLLRPLHDWAMDVLRRLPCDGTFDQPKPLIRLTGRSIVSSCDLTAATDRWPYQLISQLVESWFGRGIATAAIDTCLVSNSIHILPPWSDKPTVGMQSDVSVNLSPTRGVLGEQENGCEEAISHRFHSIFYTDVSYSLDQVIIRKYCEIFPK